MTEAPHNATIPRGENSAGRRFLVIGTGGWGTAIAHVLAERGQIVTLWGRDPDYVAQMARTRENPRALPGAKLHDKIAFSSDTRESAKGAEAVFVVIPTQYLRSTLGRFAGMIPGTVPLLSGMKGLEISTHLRPSEVMAQVLGKHPWGVFSGPSHAEEIVRNFPASLALACEDLALARTLRDSMGSPALRLYVTDDATGVELAGAIKNVLAIAAGVCDGLELGDNAKAALLTRALAEMTRFGVARGAKVETFAGLAGIGDLITTCYSRHGRNRGVGERLARGETISKILTSTTQVAEGVWTAKALFELFGGERGRAEFSTELPVCCEVYAIVHEAKDPRRSVFDLMTRPPRDGE
jgi:glycerol-3-phosphate dehydrogenase (NAD(P)+)